MQTKNVGLAVVLIVLGIVIGMSLKSNKTVVAPDQSAAVAKAPTGGIAGTTPEFKVSTTAKGITPQVLSDMFHLIIAKASLQMLSGPTKEVAGTSKIDIPLAISGGSGSSGGTEMQLCTCTASNTDGFSWTWSGIYYGTPNYQPGSQNTISNSYWTVVCTFGAFVN